LRVLLVKPRSSAAHFGLAPFFRTEPLGLEYIAAALGAGGHQVRIVDMSFQRRTMARLIKSFRPGLVGLSCVHILDAAETVQLAGEIKRMDPAIFVAVGGHAAASYPKALEQSPAVDAICSGEGESTMPALGDALAQRRTIHDVPSLLLPTGDRRFSATAKAREWLDLDQVHCPDRAAVEAYRKHYVCLNYMPVWTLETTRGCRHHCKFCSVWQFYRGSCRYHAARNVRADFEQTGRNVFIVDPDFSKDDFANFWDFVETHKLFRSGFTILTPLPGAHYFEQSKEKLEVMDLNQFDLHHLLWKPRLPVERFFELYCETWRRTVLNAAGRKKWWQWLRNVDLRHIGHMARILARSQKLMDPRAYLAECSLPRDPQ
jgi:hypothetical protein